MVKWKKACVECGKNVYVGNGVETEWRDRQRLSQPTFFCCECIKRIEKEGRDKRNAEVLAFRKSLRGGETVTAHTTIRQSHDQFVEKSLYTPRLVCSYGHNKVM